MGLGFHFVREFTWKLAEKRCWQSWEVNWVNHFYTASLEANSGDNSCFSSTTKSLDKSRWQTRQHGASRKYHRSTFSIFFGHFRSQSRPVGGGGSNSRLRQNSIFVRFLDRRGKLSNRVEGLLLNEPRRIEFSFVQVNKPIRQSERSMMRMVYYQLKQETSISKLQHKLTSTGSEMNRRRMEISVKKSFTALKLCV